MKRPFRVGHNCEAWCTKCKAESEHVVVAMIGTIPKRVECCGCGSQHNYRLAPGAGKPDSGGSQKPSPVRRTKTRTVNWKSMITAAQGVPKNYSISGKFEEGDCLDHPRFGFGVVQRVIPGGKIEVLFQQGMSLLVHQR